MLIRVYYHINCYLLQLVQDKEVCEEVGHGNIHCFVFELNSKLFGHVKLYLTKLPLST